MEERLARVLLGAAVRAARELEAFPQLLSQHGDEEERDKFKIPVGTLIYSIMSELQEPLLDRFPALRSEFEANIRDFDIYC